MKAILYTFPQDQIQFLCAVLFPTSTSCMSTFIPCSIPSTHLNTSVCNVRPTIVITLEIRNFYVISFGPV